MFTEIFVGSQVEMLREDLRFFSFPTLCTLCVVKLCP